MVEVRVKGAERLDKLAKELKVAGRTDLRKELLKEIRQAGKPLASAVKASALSLPGQGTPEARRQIAASIAVRTRATGERAGIKIVSRSTKMPAGKERLARLMNRGRWRHPTFGSEPWVTQTSDEGWFDRPIRARAPQIRAAALAAMDRITVRLKKGI